MATPETERILLALDACGITADVMERVVGMAARLHAELEGLFVEDEALLRAAQLPFATEVATTGRERSLSLEHVRAANRAASARARRLLEELAGRRNVRWRFAVAEGRRIASALAAGEHSDLFLPARAVRGTGAGAAPASGAQFRRVAFLHDASREAERAMAVIRALSENGHTREVLAVAAGASPPGLDALKGHGLRLFVQHARAGDVRALLREIGADAAGGLIILPKRLLAAASQAETEALDVVRSALLLLR